MEKKMILLLLSGFMSVSCTSSVIDNKPRMNNAIAVSEDKICNLGLLGQDPEGGINYLPDGFWGNKPQVGEVEIGYKAGDPTNTTLPEMYFNTKKTVNFMFGICFKNNPLKFSENRDNLMLGLKMEIVDTDGTILTNNSRRKARRLSDNFTYNSKTLVAAGPSCTDSFGTQETIFTEVNALVVSFVLKPGQKIKSLDYLYGDLPEEISNVSLTMVKSPEKDYIVLPYTGTSCEKNSYIVNVGSNPEYHLNSQYGSVYSIDYLRKAFIAKDRYDGTEKYPDIIDDPDDYFEKGSTAELGTEFVVKFGSEDSQANRSYITFYFKIVDSKGPTLGLIKGNNITSSYKVDFQSESFLNQYFSISDNHDDDLKKEILLSNGTPIPGNKIGTFECMLKAEDSSGNVSTQDFNLTLYDDVPPLITTTVDEINLTPYSNYNREKILGMFTAYDDINGQTPLTIIEDTYSANRTTIGDYVFTVSSEDKAGNVSKKSLVVRVQDNEGPVFYAKKSFITASKDDIPSVEEVISSLIRQKVVPDKNYVSWNIIQGEKIDSNLSVGTHEFVLILTADDNENERVDLTMEIVETTEFRKGIEEELSFWGKICLWFKNLWEKICSIFKR